MTKKQRALEIIERLKKEYPDAGCTLDYDQAWKLLVSVRLAAQCTDARVNIVVEKLYEKFPDVDALAERSAAESFDGKRLPPAHCKQKRHFTFLRSLPFPVVSVVTGFCIGSGSEIAVNSHYRICEKNARVGQPESTFGILPALGGLARTIKLCGMSNAYRLVMSGELIPAETAYALGWADFLCGKKQGYAQAVALIDWISSHRAHFSDEDSLPLLRQYLQEGAEL